MTILYDEQGNPIGEQADPGLIGDIRSVVQSPEARQLLSPMGAGKVGGPQAALTSLNSGVKNLVGPTIESESGWSEKPDDGGGTDTTALDAGDAQLARELAFRRGFGPAAAKPPAYFEPEGETYSRVGGRELYEEAFTGSRARGQAALKDQAALEGQRSDAIAAHYTQQAERDTNEAAAIKHRAIEDNAQIQVRQRKLDEATQFYTNDLADQGKFWTNPGNVIAAISFSLLPLFSNDPAVGAKLINQSMQQDMANRQKAAEGTLGALSSNLTGYRKLANDRHAGDLLAQAEMHRMAAQEIARIGAKFESPISKEKMKVLIEDQNTRYAALQMEFYKQNIHTDPTKMDPGLHKARYTGPGGWTPLGGLRTPGRPEETGGSAGNSSHGMIAGTPSTATDQPLSANARAVVRTGGSRGVLKAWDNGLINNREIETAVQASMYADARDRWPNLSPEQGYQKMIEEAESELSKIAPEVAKHAPARQAIGSLSKRMDQIERSMNGSGKDAEDFISYVRKNAPQSWVAQYEALTAKDPQKASTPAGRREAERQVAVSLMEKEFQGVLNSHIHEFAGANQSPGEIARLEKEISGLSTWKAKREWLARQDHKQQAEVWALGIGLTPAATIIHRIRTTGGTVDTASPKRGMPTRPQPKAPVLDGGMSAPMSVQSGPPAPNMSVDPRVR